MGDGWLQRTKDGTVWRVESVDVYAKCLREGFTPYEPPAVAPVLPAAEAEQEDQAEPAPIIENDHPRARHLRAR